MKSRPWVGLFVLGFLLLPFVLSFWGILVSSLGNPYPFSDLSFSLEHWRRLASRPGIAMAAYYSVCSGIVAWSLSLLISCLIVASIYERFDGVKRTGTLAAFLSVPHLSFAIGFAFLLAPSGWLFRLSHFFFGVPERPPFFNILFDSTGLAYIASLVLKEVPFLVFLQLGALRFLSVKTHLSVGKSLGYSSELIYWKALLPRVYGRIKLASYAVLAYSMAGVDIPLIVGFREPEVLQLEILSMLNHPSDFDLRFEASAASLFLFLTVFASILAVEGLIPLFRATYKFLILDGVRKPSFAFSKRMGKTAVLAGISLYAVTVSLLLVWSLANRWRFPGVFPESWSLRAWAGILEFKREVFFDSIGIAFSSSFVSLVLCALVLENDSRLNREPSKMTLALINLPLIVPQIGFILGLLGVLSKWNLTGEFVTVVWGHLLFVFPYVYLTTFNAYCSFDDRYAKIAQGLGIGGFAFFWKIKIPILAPFLLISFSVGFAVSFAQYLPTLLFGGGRVETVALEAVSAGTGSNRKFSGAYAFSQAFFPMLLYFVFANLPNLYEKLKFR